MLFPYKKIWNLQFQSLSVFVMRFKISDNYEINGKIIKRVLNMHTFV